MRFTKYALLILILIGGFAVFTEKAEANTGYSVGFGYHSGYHHYRPYYWRPYGGYGFGGYGYYPYSFGYNGYYGPSYYYRPYSYGSYYGYGYGQIRLEIKPKTAKVYVDGGYSGIVDDYDGWWQRLNVEPGNHRIVVREGGFVPYAETVRALPGNDYHIKVQMQPGDDVIQERDMRLERNDYGLRDRHKDDQYRSPRPYSGGQKQNEQREPYGEPGREPDSDNDRDNQYQSDRPAFILQVEPRDATVYIDGNYYGNADTDNSGEVQVLLPPGMHKVEVVRPGYESFSQDVDTGKESRLVVQLQKK